MERQVFQILELSESVQPDVGVFEKYFVHRLAGFLLLLLLSADVLSPRITEASDGESQSSASQPILVEVEAGEPSSSERISDAIDRFMKQGYDQRGIEGSARCEDTVFLRRLYLDLAGRIPTHAEFESWLSGDRDRTELVDHLLDSEDFVQHFADLFDTLLMGRASENQYRQRDQNQWRAYLEAAIREGRPWSQVVQEILLARPNDLSTKGAVWYLYERNDDFQKIAEAISPSIFGVRIECAQCHDHMMADEIKQAHYWGLVAFFNRGKNAKNGEALAVNESAIGGFSEFADLSGSSTPNYLSFLEAETVGEDRPAAGEEQKESDELYTSHRSPIVDRVPLFSRREKFVEEVVKDHPRLALAFVNRVWALLMGRGLVHPFDEMDSMHRPSHPELLDWLAQDSRDSDYDLRRFVRGIVRSQAYQQTSYRKPGLEDPASFAWYLERPLTGEQMARSAVVALRGSASTEAISVFREQFPDVLPKDHVSTVRDALFLSNSKEFEQLIQASDQPEHLVPSLLEIESRESQIKMLFERLFARDPDASELREVMQYLDLRNERLEQAMQQVVWSLLTSAEFRLNH
ncbi:DUF1549 and DUF1553 domain-containing protein [Rhodopirellula sp.]|nr:DUF1549 and DUF1553 domain-containing protein [Rhodopirellula sp.]